MKTKNKANNNLFVKHFLSCDQITFTAKGKEFQQTLEQLQTLGIKTRVEQYPTFVAIVKY